MEGEVQVVNPIVNTCARGMGEVHDESPLARLLGNSSRAVDDEVGKWWGGEGASCVSCRALGIQVGLDDRQASQRRADVADRMRAVAVQHLLGGGSGGWYAQVGGVLLVAVVGGPIGKPPSKGVGSVKGVSRWVAQGQGG